MLHFPFSYSNQKKANPINPILAIANLTHYYAFNNFTPNTGAVDSWNNIITANQPYNQTVSNQKGTNSNGYLSLDGVDDLYESHVSFGNIVCTTNMSLFVVAASRNPGTGDQRLITEQNSGGGTRFNFRINTQSKYSTVYNNSSNNNVEVVSNQVALVQANKFDVVARVDNGNIMTFYQNSNVVGSASNLATFTPGVGYLGAFSISQFFFNGLVAEIYLFNRALNSQEINIINSYLTAKWT